MSIDTLQSPATRRAKSAARAFKPGLWNKEIDVRDFIQQNVTPYYGDHRFLAGPTARTQAIWAKLQALFLQEREKGVLAVSQIPSSITAHDAGYIDKDHEIIVGLQTPATSTRITRSSSGCRPMRR
jgi:formate C-acetyltransferase